MACTANGHDNNSCSIRSLSWLNTTSNAVLISISVPSTLAGSGMLQWSFLGWLGKIGQLLRAIIKVINAYMNMKTFHDLLLFGITAIS